MTPELAWSIIGLMGAAVAALFGTLVVQSKRADTKHDEEIKRIREDALAAAQAVERWQEVYAEGIRADAQRTEALREFSKALERHTEAVNRSALAEVATLEFMRQMRSGQMRAVRSDGAQ